MIMTSILMKLLPIDLLFFLTVLPAVRRNWWEIFYYSHQVMIVVLVILFMWHSSLLWYYAQIPVYLYILDKLRRWYTIYTRPGKAVQITAFDDLVCLEVEVRSIFCRKWEFPHLVGSVAYLNIPKISFFQYHPMSVAFNDGNRLVFYIKTQGAASSWSHKLAALSGVKDIRVYVEGPYTMVKRAADEKVIASEKVVEKARALMRYEYDDNALFAAGGSGFAGIASYLNDAIELIRKLPEEEQEKKNLSVVLVVPHHNHLDCMKTMLLKCLRYKFCHLYLYATYSKHPELKAASPKGVNEASFSPRSPDIEDTLVQYNVIHFTVSRPDMDSIVKDMSASAMTVFFCGPKNLETSLNNALKKQSKCYTMHSEVFNM